MAKKNLLKRFSKNILSNQKANTVKGGRSYEPNVTGSTGWVNWDDVDIRRPNISVNANLTKANINNGLG